jgi:hypothetical protein
LCESWGRSNKEAERECDMKTSIQTPNLSATDETPIKHGRGQEFEQETEGTEPSGAWNQSGEGMPGSGKRRLGTEAFCRIGVGFYRLATGYYRINDAGNRILPHITASYQITFFLAVKRGKNSPQSQAELGTIVGRAARNYAGKITGFYAFFRGFPRFYALIRAVITRFYAFLRVGLFFNHGWTRVNTDSEKTWNGR